MQSFQLIPARGRKQRMNKTRNRLASISTYPRKGTETATPNAAFLTLPYHPRKGAKTEKPDTQRLLLRYHPRKGTETDLFMVNPIGFIFQLIPARGAKNSASKMLRSFSFACLNFSVFVGFFSMNRAAAAFSLPWLLYCNKMCYNRAKSKHLSQNIQLYFSFVVQLFHNL